MESKYEMLGTCQNDPLSHIFWSLKLTLIRPYIQSHSLFFHTCTKARIQLSSANPVKLIQVLLGSLPNISCTAIKPHFTAFHTIISDERCLEPSLRLSLDTSRATLSSFCKSQTVTSFWWSVCGVQSASVSPFTHWLFDEEKTIWM